MFGQWHLFTRTHSATAGLDMERHLEAQGGYVRTRKVRIARTAMICTNGTHDVMLQAQTLPLYDYHSGSCALDGAMRYAR